MESLEISCWSNTDAFQPRLNGMENYPDASEKRAKIAFFSPSDGFLPMSSLSVLIFFQVGDQERGREA